MSTTIRILAGLGLLTLGRKLFWLFVAIVGFEFGFFVAERFFQRRTSADDLVIFGIAIVFGILAALLAIFLKTVAIYVGGFLAGGSFAVNALSLLGIGAGRGIGAGDLLPIGAFIVGGIVGVILVAIVFDWALIVLSSLAGAGMIAIVVAQSFPALSVISFIVLLIVGIVVQAMMMARE